MPNAQHDPATLPAALAQHAKPCLAAALICAVENLRDDAEIDASHFRTYVGGIDHGLLSLAEDYLRDDYLTCRCHVAPILGIIHVLNTAGESYADNLAADYLGNKRITPSQYIALVRWTEGR